MSEAITWEDLEQMNYTAPPKPFFAIDHSDDDAVLNWLKQELLTLRNKRQNYLERAKNNVLRYKGYQYFNSIYYPRDVLETQRKYTPQVVLPMISDAIDEKTSRLLEMKPGIVVLPMHDETRDKVDAKIAKRFLGHIERKQKLDLKYKKLLTSSQIAGESFLWTRWNPDIGEPLQEVATAPDENGTVKKQRLFQGDVEVVHKTVQWLFYEDADTWENVNYCFIIELDYVDALKLDYPHLKDKITEDAEAKVFDFDTMQQVTLAGKCRKITFYHKKTKYMPEGYEAVFTVGALLKKGALSYNHGELPIDRMVDIENDEELQGQSSIDKVRGISSTVNNLLNSVIKMFMLAGYAKWFVEGGSVDDQQLNNDVNIVKIKAGAKAPVLAQANPVGQQHFNFISELKDWFYTFMKSNSVVRGEPPPGVTAGVALQYVSESESRRMQSSVTLFNAVRLAVNEKILKTCAQFYQKDDQRNMLLLGKDNRWENFPIEIESLQKDYAVELQNTTGLADSKALRTQQVIDLGERYPELLPREQVLEMTGLAQGDKFYDVGSAAARAAEDENEYIQDGKGQIDPQVYEDQITHWKIHVQSMQAMGFKQKAPPEIQAAMQDHIMATEMLMMDMSLNNQAFAQRIIVECPQFPLFMEVPPPIPQMGPIPADVESPAPQQAEVNPQQEVMADSQF
ncbi:MAG: hypothetical protein OM95_06950 [Bdellovibrio sp. ArHS]|uniref:hypothetical protein n=1 Tax=Bdellovibrio sp. ArHS TaxID=1569284 RepID=UPI000582CA6B|nr:hypothetical protein [Bdellovibrio sp. ArHS]KHD88848.1 MAG: hypothetical protein OM95_06950 [Bdellovibrio sp. ArHS]